MKPRIGTDISRTAARRILDMREPLVPSLSPKYRQTPITPHPTTPSQSPPPGPRPAAPTLRWYQRVVPWRVLLLRSLKLGVFIGLAFICLSLRIPLAEQLIAVYALGALLYRFDSQRTFLIALIFLALTVVWSAIGQSDRSEAFSIYTFYFLIIGLVGALRELKKF